MSASPYLIKFEQLGNPATGYITTTQLAEIIPFEIKRVFWSHGTPETAVRGQHANRLTEEVLVAISGTISVKTETAAGTESFELTSPQQGLYIPALCWTELRFLEGTISLCLASTDFNEADYIRDYNTFKQLLNRNS